MKTAADTKPKFLANLMVVVILAVVAGGVWLAVQAAMQNIRFVRGVDQLLTLVSLSREVLVRDKTVSVGEDVLLRLQRMQRLKEVEIRATPSRLSNPWGKSLTASSAGNGFVRFESAMPTVVCRRMVDFFGKDIGGLGVVRIEARDEQMPVWRLIYAADGKPAPRSLTYPLIEAGCGRSEGAGLAFTFTLN